MKSIGLALGGGGARGLCQIPFLKVLDELELKPAVISGTSIGAIIGSFYAAGMNAQSMFELLQNVGFKELTRMMDLKLFSDSALLKGEGVEEFIERYLPVRTFEECKIRLKIVATDFWSQKQVIFESGRLIEAIRASISLPAIFEPVKTENCVLIDGGAVNPVPYDIILKDCDFCIAIDVGGKRQPKKLDAVPNMFESVMSTFQIMQASIVSLNIQVQPPDMYIKPDLTNVGLMEFHKYRQIIQTAELEAAAFRDTLIQTFLKKKKKKSFWDFLG